MKQRLIKSRPHECSWPHRSEHRIVSVDHGGGLEFHGHVETKQGIVAVWGRSRHPMMIGLVDMKTDWDGSLSMRIVLNGTVFMRIESGEFTNPMIVKRAERFAMKPTSKKQTNSSK